jgi:hypothetical protein
MKYSSTADGGGDPGRGNGIVRDTMTEAGGITGATRVFIDIFIADGEMISGSIAGEANGGNTVGYNMEISIVTGATGKEPDTGTGLLNRGHIVTTCTDRDLVIRHLPLYKDKAIIPVIVPGPECTVATPVRKSPARTVTGAGQAMTDPADNPVFIV